MKFAKTLPMRSGNDESAPSGFTLLELMVTIAAITILMAVLMPALQSVRARAWNVQCISHLRQFGIATEGFFAAQGKYPGFFSKESYHAQLLPHLDQLALYNRLDHTEDNRGMSEPPSSVYNAEFLEAHVPVFVCPADSVPAGGNSYRANYGTTPGIHATWARGRPPVQPIEEESLWGGFLGARRPRDVRDGLSNTVFFSERLVGDGNPDVYTPSSDLLRVGGHHYRPADAVANCTLTTGTEEHASFLGWSWLPDDRSQTGYNHVLTPNSPIPDCFDRWNIYNVAQGAMTARSYHPGGVNVVFADGSTKFINESIDLYVWRRLGTSDGGEIIDGFY